LAGLGWRLKPAAKASAPLSPRRADVDIRMAAQRDLLTAMSQRKVGKTRAVHEVGRSK
jgi:hypothetical protein